MRSYLAGVYQMGEDQARSWMVAGTSGDNGWLFLAESTRCGDLEHADVGAIHPDAFALKKIR